MPVAPHVSWRAAQLSRQLLRKPRRALVALAAVAAAFALLGPYARHHRGAEHGQESGGAFFEAALPRAPMSQLQRQAAAAAAQLTARTRALAEARGLRLSSSPGLGSSVHASAATAASSGRGGGSRRRDGGGKAARKKHKFSEKLKRLVSEALDEDGNDTDICRGEEHTDYPGEMVVVAAGGLNLQDSVGDCCASCMAHPECNVWVWCGQRQGCGGRHAFGECWLKRAAASTIRAAAGSGRPDIPWTSGNTLDAGVLAGASGQDRQQGLREDAEMPLVYLDVAIKGRAAGRIVLALFYNATPLAAENFRQLCTGEKGVVPPNRPGAGQAYSLKGAPFDRGDASHSHITFGIRTGSVFGAALLEEDLAGGPRLPRLRPGLLSMATSAGSGQQGARFRISTASAVAKAEQPRAVFGEVVEGMGVARAVSALGMGKSHGTAAGEEQAAVVVDCGVIRPPTRQALEKAHAAAALLPQQQLASGAGGNSSSSSSSSSSSNSSSSRRDSTAGAGSSSTSSSTVSLGSPAPGALHGSVASQSPTAAD